jgi:NifU-like protein
MWDYSEKVRQHYLHPVNVGEIKNPDGYGEVGNLKCGDALRLTFKLDENKEKITDIKFKTFGCGSAIASSSILTELCKGKTLEEASKITNQEIADTLGGLPSAKMHCSVMCQEALEKAIDYYNNDGKTVEVEEKEGTVICNCFNVTDLEIKQAITQNKLTTVEDVTNYTKAGGGCGGCVPQIEEILAEITGIPIKKPEPIETMTTIEKIDKIRKVLDKDIRPLLQKDGGDCELVDLNGNVVLIRFTGKCKGCGFVDYTQCQVVEKILKKKVFKDLTAQQV